MPQIHIKLPEATHRQLKQKANKFNYSIQELAEKTLSIAAASENWPALFSSSNMASRSSNHLFTFIDLFSGIGGMRLAFEEHGGLCMFSSEWDKWCQKTYFENFGEIPEGDITEIAPKDIPDHDILTAGFPCQPFSIAGVSKKKSLGREHGFKDKTQGTLFFNVASIIEEKRPRMFLLENVKNLLSHDRGNTFKIITRSLRELGYILCHKVIDARWYVPQHRERIFIAGFDRAQFGERPNFNFPSPPEKERSIGNILERDFASKYILSDKLWNYLQEYAKKHRRKGNGFGFGLVDKTSVSRTLSARYYKDGSEILIKLNGSNPRRLTPRECARLMGFPDSFRIPVSDAQAYRQFGNSVVVPVVSAVAGGMVKTWHSLQEIPARKATTVTY